MDSMMRKPLMGLVVVAMIALVVTLLADWPLFRDLQLSAMVLGVVLGMILANSVRPYFPEEWAGGLSVVSKKFLRGGIVFYGFRLSLSALFNVGAEAILVDSIVVVGTLVLGNYLGRLLGLPKDERLLISSGSAICGAAAVLATEPVLKAKSHSTVVAVATVVLFGTLSMLLYPILYRTGMLSALSDKAVGVYTGATVHEVAHVVGAGAGMGSEIAEVATITKMIRVILLAPVLLLLSLWITKDMGKKNAQPKLSIQVPWFAFYFIGIIVLNTLLTNGAERLGYTEVYGSITQIIQIIDTFALTMAMVAIGLDATFAKFRQSGLKPFLLAFGLYIWLVVGGYIMVRLLFC